MTVAADNLKQYAQRIAKLREEQRAISADIADVVTEAKSFGYDGPTLRKVVMLMEMDAAEREERDVLLDLYRSAVGIGGIPETLPADQELAKARALFDAGKTVREVATALKISVGKAHKLKVKAKAFTLFTADEREHEHDPDTGEILESGAPLAAAPVQGGGLADEDSDAPDEVLVINSTSHGSIEGRTIESGVAVVPLPPSTAPAARPEPPAVWPIREDGRPDANRTSDPGTSTAGGPSPADLEAMRLPPSLRRIA